MSSSPPIRVLIVDDHAVIRDGLSQLLGQVEDVDVTATARDGEEAIRVARSERPDVILMDLEMPGVDGAQAARRIIGEDADARIVILTAFSDRDRIIDALDAGAIGYLLKDADPDELLRGIRAAARGESPLAPKAATAVLSARSERRTPTLSDREREVLTLLADGLPNKLIARELGISEKTVKAHVTRIFQVLGVTDRTQAALWAQRNGFTQRS